MPWNSWPHAVYKRCEQLLQIQQRFLKQTKQKQCHSNIHLYNTPLTPCGIFFYNRLNLFLQLAPHRPQLLRNCISQYESVIDSKWRGHLIWMIELVEALVSTVGDIKTKAISSGGQQEAKEEAINMIM